MIQTEKNKLLLSTAFILTLILIVFYSRMTSQKESLEQTRTKILNELQLAIEDAVFQEKYKCCINPPCTMCYLGNWIWKNGSCYCENMIKENKLNFVCPECLRGIKEGRCKSGIGSCQIINSSEVK